jgi:hypothetical protein
LLLCVATLLYKDKIPLMRRNDPLDASSNKDVIRSKTLRLVETHDADIISMAREFRLGNVNA